MGRKSRPGEWSSIQEAGAREGKLLLGRRAAGAESPRGAQAARLEWSCLREWGELRSGSRKSCRVGPAAGLSILSAVNTRSPAEQMGHGTRDQELRVESFEIVRAEFEMSLES